MRVTSFAYAWAQTPSDATSLIPFTWGTTTWRESIPQLVRNVNSMPVGHRALHVWDLQVADHGTPDMEHDPRDFSVDPQTGATFPTLWWDNGVQNVRSRLLDFIGEFKRQGGVLDYFIIDVESYYTGVWGLTQCGSAPYFDIPCNQVDARIRAIEADPRFQTQILPTLASMGFPTDRSLNYNLTHRVNWNSIGDNFLIWDSLMLARTAQYYRAAYVDPVVSLFPNVKISNYGWSAASAELQIPDRHGNRGYLYGDLEKIGNRQAPSLYGYLGSINVLRLDGVNFYEATPFNALRYDLNLVRAGKLSDPAPMNPWLCNKEFSTQYRNSDLYQELVFHVLLTGGEDLLFWNPRTDGFSGSDTSDRLLDRSMKEFDKIAGVSGRRSSVDRLIGWGDDFILTCSVAAGRNVCRFTPRPNLGPPGTLVVTEDDGVIIQTPTSTIQFPHGVVWRPSESQSAAGLWLVSPEQDTPLVTAP